MIKNKRILILGGAGFMGYHLAKRLEKQGFYIDLVDDLSRGKIDKDFESLSPREQEVISMAAMGKTDAEIATIAGISTNTVRYHWKNIFSKMDSYSRVFAIIRALNLGYVNTQRFELPTSSGSGETYQKSV